MCQMIRCDRCCRIFFRKLNINRARIHEECSVDKFFLVKSMWNSSKANEDTSSTSKFD